MAKVKGPKMPRVVVVGPVYIDKEYVTESARPTPAFHTSIMPRATGARRRRPGGSALKIAEWFAAQAGMDRRVLAILPSLGTVRSGSKDDKWLEDALGADGRYPPPGRPALPKRPYVQLLRSEGEQAIGHDIVYHLSPAEPRRSPSDRRVPTIVAHSHARSANRLMRWPDVEARIGAFCGDLGRESVLVVVTGLTRSGLPEGLALALGSISGRRSALLEGAHVLLDFGRPPPFEAWCLTAQERANYEASTRARAKRKEAAKAKADESEQVGQGEAVEAERALLEKGDREAAIRDCVRLADHAVVSRSTVSRLDLDYPDALPGRGLFVFPDERFDDPWSYVYARALPDPSPSEETVRAAFARTLPAPAPATARPPGSKPRRRANRPSRLAGLYIDDIRHGRYSDMGAEPVNDSEQLAHSISVSRERRDMYARITEVPALRRRLERLSLTVKLQKPVLVHGPSGSGKTGVARLCHDLSDRSGRCVRLQCARLSDPQAAQSTLFGHRAHAFTGADQAREGAFVRAHRGTLVLDDLDALPPAVQGQLLTSAEERTIRRLGDDVDRPVDVLLVVTVNQDPRRLVAEGRLREDLYYRLRAGALVHVPPLRDREADARRAVHDLWRRLMDEAFVRKEARSLREAHHDWSSAPPRLVEAVMRSPLPGNFRSIESATWAFFEHIALSMKGQPDRRLDPADVTLPDDVAEMLFPGGTPGDLATDDMPADDGPLLEPLWRGDAQLAARTAREARAERIVELWVEWARGGERTVSMVTSGLLHGKSGLLGDLKKAQAVKALSAGTPEGVKIEHNGRWAKRARWVLTLPE